ncbi:MAG: preprotein translocase subunit SecE [Clostridia bacterium]|nr:preprotein translocase subunit SecE [Clostridia bacterium]
MAENEKNVVETKSQKPAKAKKPSLGAKIKKACKEFKAEFKKIVWSSKKNTFNNTVLVIVSMAVVALCVGVLDYAFSSLLSALGGLI